MARSVLQVEGLRVYYHLPQGTVRAVDGVSFSVGRGEVLGVAGESGSGKSTLALAIMRLVRPPGIIEGGRILLDGVNILELSEDEMRKLRGSKLAMVFQDPNTYLNPAYSVGFQTGEVFEAHRGVKPLQAFREVISLFRKVMLSDPERRFHSYPHQLSGGMKQRVLISMAIALKPALLIADEPTSALDVTIQAEIVKLLADIRKEMGMSVLFVSHDLGLLSRVADRIMVMYAGKVAEVGKVKELIEDPAHPYTKALLSASRSERKAKLPVIEGAPPNLMRPPPGCRFHPRCPLAQPRCASVEPELRELGKGRMVACLLYGGA